MAKLTDIKYVVQGGNGNKREEISLYTTREEAGDMCKAFKLPDGSKAYAAIGDVKSKLATMKRFKIQGKEYAALTEAEKKKDKIKKVYIFKAGSHRFKVPFWAKKIHYTLCGGGNGIISTNAPILDTIEKDGITDNKSIMMARKVNDAMYATIPLMGRRIMGEASSMYVEMQKYYDESNPEEFYIGEDETRSVSTAIRHYNNYDGNNSWFMQTTDNKSKGFSVYQADASVYNNMGQDIKTTPVVTRKKVVIAPTMINPDIVDTINYDNLVSNITSGLPMLPPMGPVENEGEYVRLTAIKDDTSFTVYNKGFKALYNVYPKSDLVRVVNISKFINDTLAKYKVNLVDKDIYHDEDNSLMINSFINQAYIFNSYTPFDKLYSAGIAMYNDGSTPPSKTDSLIQSTYDAAFNQYKAKPDTYKQRYDNVTYYMRKQFLDGTIFDYDYMMQLKDEEGLLDSVINSSILSNMDLVDGAYDFATGHHTSPKLSETRLGAKEVIFDIQCLDGVVRPLSVKYGGSLVLGWDKYFDDAYCYDIEDIDIYRAEEFTKLFNPLSGNLVPNPIDGQEITGTWDVKPDEYIVIEVGTHGKLYTEDMEFKLNKYFHDRDADGICILEVEGDFKDIDDIDSYTKENRTKFTPDQYNQMITLDPLVRDYYGRLMFISPNFSGDIDMSSQDVFNTNKFSKAGYINTFKSTDDMANGTDINLYLSSRSHLIQNMPSDPKYTLNIFGYDIGPLGATPMFHQNLGVYFNLKMNIAEDLISNLTEYNGRSSDIYQSVVPVRSYYADKERTFIFKNANTINYAFRYGVQDGGYTPRVKLDYSKSLDVNGALIFTSTKGIDYRWYVSLGMYINPSTAKNINVNERLFISYPNESTIKNKKIKIFKPWVTYDQSKAYIKYVVPKDYTTKSIIGIIPTLDQSINNIYIDISNIKDEPFTISPTVNTNSGKIPNVQIIDNSGITERKFNGLFTYAAKNYLSNITLAPSTMAQFAMGASADLSGITLKTSSIKDFSSAFNEFNGKYPKNIDLSSCTNFNSLFYNINLDTINIDNFVDSSFVATKAVKETLQFGSMFTSFTGRDISFDVWGFLVKKAKLLELLKSYLSVNMYGILTYVRGIPFFSMYEIYMAISNERFFNLSLRRDYNSNINGIASQATFKELEVPILNNLDDQFNNKFSLNVIGTNGIGKLVFRQPPDQNIVSLDALKVSITSDTYCKYFINNIRSDNTYKLPTAIVVRLLRDKTSIPNTAESIEAIKTFLNAVYTTPKENISVIFE